jgi:hypothetical protein
LREKKCMVERDNFRGFEKEKKFIVDGDNFREFEREKMPC